MLALQRAGHTRGPLDVDRWLSILTEWANMNATDRQALFRILEKLIASATPEAGPRG